MGCGSDYEVNEDGICQYVPSVDPVCVECTYDSHCGEGMKCCNQKCYNPDTQKCCGNMCSPVIEDIIDGVAVCCDANGDEGDGLEELCTGDTPYCVVEYEVGGIGGDLCLSTGKRECVECVSDFDCGYPFSDSSCCNGECISNSGQVCCGIYGCEEANSRSEYCVESGTCYKAGPNTECLDKDTVNNYKKVKCDSYNCIFGTIEEDIYQEALAATSGATSDVTLRDSFGVSPFVAVLRNDEDVTAMAYKGVDYVGASFSWGDGDIQASLTGGFGWKTRYKEYLIQTGYVKVQGENRGRGRGRGGDKPIWQATFSSVSDEYIEYFGWGGPGFKVKINDQWSTSFHVTTDLNAIGYDAGLLFNKGNGWLFLHYNVAPGTDISLGSWILGGGIRF